MAVFGQTATYRDAKGQTAKTSFFVSAATPALALTAATAIVNLITPLTNAHLNSAKGAYTTSPTANVYGTAAQYQSIEDKALLTFQTASGGIHRYQIPSPKVSIFMADEETVDPANTDVAAFAAAMITDQASSRDGSLITGFIGGIYIRRKFQRRFNIFTKDPSESGPGE